MSNWTDEIEEVENLEDLEDIKSPLMDLALSGTEDSDKLRVMRLCAEAGIRPDDPVFLVLLAAGQMEAAISTAPKDIDGLLMNWAGQLQSTFTSIV